MIINILILYLVFGLGITTAHYLENKKEYKSDKLMFFVLMFIIMPIIYPIFIYDHIKK